MVGRCAVDMIERVARVLCAGDADQLGPMREDDGRKVDAGKPRWSAYVGEAEDALEAIREPTPEMIKAGGLGGVRTSGRSHERNSRQRSFLGDAECCGAPVMDERSRLMTTTSLIRAAADHVTASKPVTIGWNEQVQIRWNGGDTADILTVGPFPRKKGTVPVTVGGRPR
jgi:hypothetical protein